MRDYSSISLADARREYLATSTTAMPIGGFVAWAGLAVAAYSLGDRLPTFAPFIAANAAGEPDLLILGLAILAGMVWVPHGWGADDPAGFVHFVLRVVLCYAAYLFAPDPARGALIAGAAALTYGYALFAMKKPSSVG